MSEGMLGLHNMLDGAQICFLFPMNNKSQNLLSSST
jgi:hypothetical protein